MLIKLVISTFPATEIGTSGYNTNDLLRPNDSTITTHYFDEGYCVELRFPEFAGDYRITKKENELKELSKREGYEVVENFNYVAIFLGNHLQGKTIL